MLPLRLDRVLCTACTAGTDHLTLNRQSRVTPVACLRRSTRRQCLSPGGCPATRPQRPSPASPPQPSACTASSRRRPRTLRPLRPPCPPSPASPRRAPPSTTPTPPRWAGFAGDEPQAHACKARLSQRALPVLATSCSAAAQNGQQRALQPLAACTLHRSWGPTQAASQPGGLAALGPCACRCQAACAQAVRQGHGDAELWSSGIGTRMQVPGSLRPVIGAITGLYEACQAATAAQNNQREKRAMEQNAARLGFLFWQLNRGGKLSLLRTLGTVQALLSMLLAVHAACCARCLLHTLLWGRMQPAWDSSFGSSAVGGRLLRPLSAACAVHCACCAWAKRSAGPFSGSSTAGGPRQLLTETLRHMLPCRSLHPCAPLNPTVPRRQAGPARAGRPRADRRRPGDARLHHR